MEHSLLLVPDVTSPISSTQISAVVWPTAGIVWSRFALLANTGPALLTLVRIGYGHITTETASMKGIGRGHDHHWDRHDRRDYDHDG